MDNLDLGLVDRRALPLGTRTAVGMVDFEVDRHRSVPSADNPHAVDRAVVVVAAVVVAAAAVATDRRDQAVAVGDAVVGVVLAVVAAVAVGPVVAVVAVAAVAEAAAVVAEFEGLGMILAVGPVVVAMKAELSY